MRTGIDIKDEPNNVRHRWSQPLIMSATIDFQGFTVNHNEFIIKELDIINHQDFKVQHWIFKPPYDESWLDESARHVKQWLENNHHGVKWSTGVTDYTCLKNILLTANLPFNTLYVKGREKCEYLQNLLQRHVIDLADLGCPALKSLPQLLFYC